MIVKNVNQRFTAEQAYNHPWIQNGESLSKAAVQKPEYAVDIKHTMDLLKMQKIVLLYMTNNKFDIKKLEQNLVTADANQSGTLARKEFEQAVQGANMPITARLFEELYEEIDKEKTGQIQYMIFVNQVSIAKMYLNELELYNTLLKEEPEGVGGVTIKEM